MSNKKLDLAIDTVVTKAYQAELGEENKSATSKGTKKSLNVSVSPTYQQNQVKKT